MAVGLPSTTIAAALGIEQGQPVWEIWRRRSIGQTDRILERAVLPLSRVPAIDHERIERGESLYRYTEERYGLTDEYTEQAFDCFEQCYRASKFTFYTAGQTRHRILSPSELSNWSVAPLTPLPALSPRPIYNEHTAE